MERELEENMNDEGQHCIKNSVEFYKKTLFLEKMSQRCSTGTSMAAEDL